MAIYKLKESAKQHFKKVKRVEIMKEPEEMKRFNLRLANGDMDFIKFLAEKESKTKNQIIDELIKSIIKDFLMSLETDEYIMLIKEADALNNVDTWNDLGASWISDLYRVSEAYDYSQIDHDLHNRQPSEKLEGRSSRYTAMFTAIQNSKLKNSKENARNV